MGAALAAQRPPGASSLTGDGGFNMIARRTGDRRGAWGCRSPSSSFNNAASGYVKALQHPMFGAGTYQSSDLVEIDYAAIAEAMGCTGIRVEDPDELAARSARAWRPTAARPSSTSW